MNECARVGEVFQAVADGRWPNECDADLRAHAAACQPCADAALVAAAIREERNLQIESVRIPSAGLVWWRSELRARRDAARQAERPVSVMEAFAAACAIGVAIAFAKRLLPSLQDLRIEALAGLTPLSLALAAAIVIAAPVALYFVLSDK